MRVHTIDWITNQAHCPRPQQNAQGQCKTATSAEMPCPTNESDDTDHGSYESRYADYIVVVANEFESEVRQDIDVASGDAERNEKCAP